MVLVPGSIHNHIHLSTPVHRARKKWVDGGHGSLETLYEHSSTYTYINYSTTISYSYTSMSTVL